VKRIADFVEVASAVVALCAAVTIPLPAQTFSTLYSFCLPGYPCTGGDQPSAGLVQGIDGNLYGTTTWGGANNTCCEGAGTVFKITTNGALTTLYSFCAETGCADGANPYGTLLQAGNGALYGTTASGGAYGGGTVFKVTPSGTLTTLYGFCAQSYCTDGQSPRGALIQASNGDLYGTTYYGGVNSVAHNGNGGTIFKITPSGTLTTVYSFCAQSECADGLGPYAGLVQASNGDFYGTTQAGGAKGCEYGCGTVFKMTPGATLHKLYDFCAQSGCTDGYLPTAALVQAANGNLYGTTQADGPSGGGTLFQVTLDGKLTTLYGFCSQAGCADGYGPTAALVQGTDGNLYGTAPGGGGSNWEGTVFEITTNGTLTALYAFCEQSGDSTGNCPDGAVPSGVFQATDGSFYGTTQYGGAALAYGAVFGLSVDLGPFVQILPASGKVGAVVKILGTDLTGTTAVTFKGAAAAFKVVSSTEITATVPTGATTGTVQVTTPGGPLNSNVAFRVTP